MAFSVQERYGPEPFTPLTHPLTKLAGAFNFTGRIWPTDDDLTEEVLGQGSATIELAADGRFIQMTWQGTAAGDRWAGTHAFGYDSGSKNKGGNRGIKEVFYNRYGNFGVGSGVHDGISNRIEVHGQTDECGRGVEKYRTVFTIIHDNQFSLEVFMTSGKTGQESKARELVFTRV
jgi:hypothetical protein